MAFDAITGPNWIVPTAAAGDASNRVADTAFVTSAIASAVASAAANATVLQVKYADSTAFVAGTTNMAGAVDTIPIKTDGLQILSLTITPTATTNNLLVTSLAPINNSATVNMWIALFQDTTTSALSSEIFGIGSPNVVCPAALSFQFAAGTTGPTTLKINVGGFVGAVATWTLNGAANPAGRRLGGSSRATLVVQEIKV